MQEIADNFVKEKLPVWRKIVVILQMVKFSHTVFALPIALMSAFIASGGWVPTRRLVLIVLAMVGARNGGMAFNRLVDMKYDSLNPRTSERALPKGQLSQLQVCLFIFACSVLYFVSAYLIGNLAFLLSPVIIAVIFSYSYTKRFTTYSHLFLGIALGLAPVGAWIAIKDSIDLLPVVLGLAVVFWVAGFDIIYACQDADFDREIGLHSIPQRFGVGRALFISASFHLITAGLLFWVKSLARLGDFYLIGWLGVSFLLFYEHYLVRPNDLSRVNQAFCLVNAMVSVVLFLGTTLDYIFKV